MASVDHMCSYAPRAGQEHMHNRLSFGTADMPHANMDGYERLIAFATGERVDVAVAQVASLRLRRVTPLPPEEWDARVDVLPLDGELVYRRTAVFVRSEEGDYLVLRDQYRAPRELTATYNLHVLGDDAERKGGKVRFDGLTLVLLGGESDAFAELPFSYERGKNWSEATKGVRFARTGTGGEFISVLLLGGSQAVAPTEYGVRVGDEEIRFAGGIDVAAEAPAVKVLAGEEQLLVLEQTALDLARSQGEIGLFVPDAGYPFGPIPDWLIEQRTSTRPDWYRSWDEIIDRATVD